MDLCVRCENREAKVYCGGVGMCYSCWALTPVLAEEDEAFRERMEACGDGAGRKDADRS